MRIAYFDCYSGISGDMTIGAFLDAGLSFDTLSRELSKLKIKGYELKKAKVKRQHLAGTKFDCVVKGVKAGHRPIKEIITLIDESSLKVRVKKIAKDIFASIAAAESKVHGANGKSDTPLHELGDIDSIIDIVGTAIAIDELGIDEVYSSAVNLGRTFVNTRHGTLPIPSPASLELLKGVPIKLLDIGSELVTPTGASILKTLSKSFGRLPQVEISRVGYGAGSRDLSDAPNMLRVIIGEAKEAFKEDKVFIVETNIDDMSPQSFEYLFEKLFKIGALDVYVTPIQMKKTRPAFKLTALSEPKDLERISQVILSETTTIGLRFYEAGRFKLDRKIVKAKTRYGDVDVKVASGPGKILKSAPEYDACVRIARKKNVPLKDVYEEARKAVLFLLIIGFLLLGPRAGADTINTTDGKELKGIVVEDYNDRLVLSTENGEATIMKDNISQLYFDSEEENLIKLAEQAQKKNDLTTAFVYYDMAYKRNPLSKAAKDGLVFLQGYLFRKEEAGKEEEIKKQEEIEQYGSVAGPMKTAAEKAVDAARKLKETIGITLTERNGSPQIESVRFNSPAYNAGVMKADLLVAIWSRLTGYMPLNDVIYTILEKSSFEIKCTLERTVDIVPDKGLLVGAEDMIGAKLAMEFEGLTALEVKEGAASFNASIKPSDLIVAIDGQSTRYMPLKKALDTIKNIKSDTIKLTLRREIIIWRKEKENTYGSQ